MNQRLGQIAIVVRDYDEAIKFYTELLGFELLEDTVMSATKRWVRVKPRGAGTCELLLAKAANEIQSARIGNQTGGRVFLFLYTDDIQRDYDNLIRHKVKIIRNLTNEPYGDVLVFEDLYGNLWDLIQPI